MSEEEAPVEEAAAAAEEPSPPLLRVVRGDPTPEELAALTAVVAGMAAAGAEGRARPRSEWNSPYRQIRPFYSHGPGGWRSSGLPKHRGRGN